MARSRLPTALPPGLIASAPCRTPSRSMARAEPWSFASAEAQIAAIADDIAYDAHDIDDGLRAGLFVLEDLADVPLIHDILRRIREQHPALDPSRSVHELVRRLITQMIEDVIAETSGRVR